MLLKLTILSSKYLIPMDVISTLQQGRGSEELSEPLLSSSTSLTWTSGCLSCPLLFRHSIPLHWRLKAQQALNALAMDLSALAVTNRKNTFVIKAKESIYYLELSESEENDALDASVSSLGADENLEASTRSLVSPSMSFFKALKNLDRSLSIDIYGVDLLDTEVADGLVKVLETKVDSLVQTAIQMVLSRNIRLIPSDLEFILPNWRDPSKIMSYCIPNILKFPRQLMTHFRHNLCTMPQQSLNILEGLEVSMALKKGRRGGIDEHEVVEECLLLYNSQTSKPGTSIGQGIATLSLRMYEKTGVTPNDDSNLIHTSDLHLASEMLSPIVEGADLVNNSNAFLQVEVYIRGSLSLSALVERLEKALFDAFCQYAMDSLIEVCPNLLIKEADEKSSASAIPASELSITSWLGSCAKVFSHASSAARFSQLQLPLSLPPWERTALVELLPHIFDEKDGNFRLLDMSAFDPTEDLTLFPSEYVFVSGLSHSPKRAGRLERKSSLGSDKSGPSHLRKVSQEEASLETSSLYGRRGSRQLNTALRMVAEEGLGPFAPSHDPVLLLFLDSKSLLVYGYNAQSQIWNTLQTRLMGISNWTIRRHNLLSEVCQQKLGLFHHTTNADVKNNASENYSELSLNDFEELIEHQLPPKTQRTPITNMEVVAKFTLRDCLKVLDSEEVCWDAYPDTAQRHGKEFLVLLKKYRDKTDLEDILKRFKFGKERFEWSDAQKLVQEMTLYHFCRTPLLFVKDFYEDLFVSSGDAIICTYSAAPDFDRLPKLVDIGWYKQLIEECVNAYNLYLETLGMRLMSVQSESRRYLETPNFLYGKLTDRGLLIAQVSVEVMFVCVNVFCLDAGETQPRQETPLLYEAAAFKNLIHVNSFVYDFHLRYLMDFLLPQHEKIDVNVIDMLRAFVRYNSVKGNFSRNRIIAGNCTLHVPDLKEHVLSYFFQSPDRIGFKSVYSGGKCIGCYIRSPSPDFQSTPDYESLSVAYTYSLFLSLASQQDPQGFCEVLYYVVILDEKNKCPLLSNRIETEKVDPLNEVFGGMMLRDLETEAVAKIYGVAQVAIDVYERDTFWKALTEMGSNGGNPTALSHVLDKVLSSQRSILTLTPELTLLFEDTNFSWTKVLDEIMQKWKSDSRSFNSFPSSRNLILFNPFDKNYLLHLQLRGGKLTLFTLAKDGIPSDVETRHVELLVDFITKSLTTTK